MRCKQKVLRNGYWTGRQCSREATKVVIFHRGALAGLPHYCCTQHAQKMLDNPWAKPEVRDISEYQKEESEEKAVAKEQFKRSIHSALEVRVDDSNCIVLRTWPRPGIHSDVTITDVDALVDALREAQASQLTND